MEELKTKHYIGLTFGAIIIILDFVLFFNFTGDHIGATDWYFNPLLVIGTLIGSICFILDYMAENDRQKELETKFLEFVRGLVETVRSGVTIPQSIINISTVNYGSLTPYIRKLANQIEWGYPFHTALTIFANDTNNPVIKRSVAIVIEAEKSGGDMGSVLEAVTRSVLEIKNIKEERKSNAYTQIIQSYIIYFFFVAIMLVLQVYLIPKLSMVGAEVSGGMSAIAPSLAGGGGGNFDFGPIFLATIVIQGLFAGLMLGKFSDGDYKSGIKHSLFMVLGGYLITSTVTGIMQPAEALVLLIPYGILKKK